MVSGEDQASREVPCPALWLNRGFWPEMKNIQCALFHSRLVQHLESGTNPLSLTILRPARTSFSLSTSE